MEFFSKIGWVVTGSGFEDIVYQARMCALGRKNEAIPGKHIAVTPSLFMNVVQKLLRDFYPEYISNIRDEIKEVGEQSVGRLLLSSQMKNLK